MKQINIQGKGVAKMLLADAVKCVLAISLNQEIDGYAIVVDAVSRDAQTVGKFAGFLQASRRGMGERL